LRLAWVILLILPAATTLSASAHTWDLNPWALFAGSCWLVLLPWQLMPQRLFLLLSYPVALVGIVCMGGDFMRHVDVLELALQWRTFSALDVSSALRPYFWTFLGAAVLLAGLCGLTARSTAWLYSSQLPRRPPSRTSVVALMLASAALVVLAPTAIWVRVWPTDAALVAASALTNSRVLAQYLFPISATINPRDPAARWHARRLPGADAQASVVFIIGESIRSDFLSQCGGPPRVQRLTPPALVACDVTSGSDSTHTSVPLLVSREMPGHGARVSSDATFMQAFAETGFDTSWFGVQGSGLAWADARHQVYPDTDLSDAAALLPLLESALNTPPPLKAIVLHAYNAHEPYCSRYLAASAPYRVECRASDRWAPTRETLPRVKLQYANAVDASIGFVNAVITRLDRLPTPAFLIFTPDHGENLLDDRRNLWGHALRSPTPWDTHVPAVFWANTAWRTRHAVQWARLRAQVALPLMHADLVPSLLAAAGIAYEDPRQGHGPVDLLDQNLPPRHRIVQESLGSVVDWQVLAHEAE
jgi:glucan phosphoethanolaminetransferase (alkaline phosphatase superfamily)